jgi:hypothetical protein
VPGNANEQRGHAGLKFDNVPGACVDHKNALNSDMGDRKDTAKKGRGNSRLQCSTQLVQDTQQGNTVAPLFSNTIFLES